MEDASTVCAELDCLLSFAEAARAFNYQRPRMVEDPVVDIVQGRYACVDRVGDGHLSSRVRHPLQEQILDTFVPNDARLVGGVGFGMCYEDDTSDMGAEATWSSVVLCTGANACGKVSAPPTSLLITHRNLSLQSVYLKQVGRYAARSW